MPNPLAPFEKFFPRLKAARKAGEPFENFGARFVKQGFNKGIPEALGHIRGIKKAIVEGDEMALMLRAASGDGHKLHDALSQTGIATFFSRMTGRKNDAVRNVAFRDIIREELESTKPVTRSHAAEILQEKRRQGVEVPESLTIEIRR